MPVVSSLLGVLGASLGLYVLSRSGNEISLPDPILSDDAMCGLTTGGVEECWWGCKFKTKTIPFVAEYSVRYFVTKFFEIFCNKICKILFDKIV